MRAAVLVLAWPSGSTYASTTRLFVVEARTRKRPLAELYERDAIAAQRLASYVELRQKQLGR